MTWLHVFSALVLFCAKVSNVWSYAFINPKGMPCEYRFCEGDFDLTYNNPGLCTTINGTVRISGAFTHRPACLTNITGDFITQHNTQITDFTGLETLIQVGTHVTIWNNPLLQNLNGLDGLKVIGYIARVQALTDSNLLIQENPKLVNLDGFSNLTVVYGDFRIVANAALKNLWGLKSMYFVEGLFEIDANPQLLTLHGLEALRMGGQR
ncbi:hypothetical protein CYMTET_7612 [Cymbomonas tetramitiformis]|uniref:Receptor L-domain domain-containing protein n=1 Tax=Cymbomonas tetramitiformis TaxID=36881 RepID=A0AAE0GVC1_9CHLO|nr:hypothetical protein CYMTET_7612 [Cymbomonas tetramitiformis]